MYIRRPHLENLLRRLVLGCSSNVRTLIGSVRGLEVDKGTNPRVNAVTVRTPSGEEVSINDPALVVGTCSSPRTLLRLLITYHAMQIVPATVKLASNG